MSDSLLSEEAIVRALVDRGVPRAAAEREAKRQRGEILPPQRFGVPDRIVPPPSLSMTRAPIEIAWPVRLLLPWSYLVSDNDKTRARLITRAGEPKAINVITAEFAAAKEKIAKLATNKVDGAAAVAMPLGIRGLVWVPDERPHDVSNFCKLVHDALEGVVYANDRWLHDVHWTRAGVDVDAPRAEITITPILTT